MDRRQDGHRWIRTPSPSRTGTGKQYTFQTTADTRIRSREVHSLADLKTGMVVLVGAKDLGNGSYQAQVVQVLPRR